MPQNIYKTLCKYKSFTFTWDLHIIYTTYMDNTGLDNSTSPNLCMDFYLHVKQIHLVEFGIR